VIEFLLLNQSCDAQLRASDDATALHYLVRHFPHDSEAKKASKYVAVANKLVQKVRPALSLSLSLALSSSACACS
jgi:hypothetical protein